VSRIGQCRMSAIVKKSFGPFVDRHGLSPYTDPSAPVVFYGLYTPDDAQALSRHKGLAIVLWRGSDIMKFPPTALKVMTKPNVRHLAISSFIQDDLAKANVPCKVVPIVGSDMNGFSPTPLGSEIYAYAPKTKPKFYRQDLLDRVVERCGFGVNVVESPYQFDRVALRGIYERCFLGIRLTPHDGIANSVVELGLMGRRSIYNGGQPSAIPWGGLDDILTAIQVESKRVGQVDHEMARAVFDYINVGESWLTTEYWDA